jgi:hypothetical protein
MDTLVIGHQTVLAVAYLLPGLTPPWLPTGDMSVQKTL